MLAPKHIVVRLEGLENDATTLETAVAVANRFGASLEAVFAKPPFAYMAAVDAAMLPMAAEAHETGYCARAAAAERTFKSAVNSVKAGAAWLHIDGRPLDIMLQRGCYADLTIICQAAGYDIDFASEYSMPADLVMALGRPVLMVPAGRAFGEFGRKALIAWKPVREAARAMADALPYIAGARKASIMLFNPDDGESAGHDLGRYLARHGIECGVLAVRSKKMTVGEAILSTAYDMSADLLVMGAYGHARLREMILGGATHTVLRDSKIPVLMSH